MGAGTSSLQGLSEDDLRRRKKGSVDPVLEKLQNLHVVPPIIKQQPTDASITEILLQRSSSQASDNLDPTSTAKLFTLFQEWQRETAANVGKNQEELGYKIIGVEELSIKLFHRLNYAKNVMEASAAHLQEVHLLQAEISEMKSKLTDALESYEKLSEKVASLGLHKRNIHPVAVSNQREHRA